MKEIKLFEAHDSYVLGLVFTNDSRRLVSSSMDNLIKIWSVPGWEAVNTFQGHTNSVNGFVISPDEKILASGSSDNTVKIWSFPDGKLLNNLQDRKKVVSCLQISADGKQIAAGSYGGRAAVWTIDGEAVTAFKASKKNLSSVAFSPDGSMLATAGLGDDVRLWQLPSGNALNSLQGHQTAVWNLKFVEQGNILVSLGYEGIIRFWDTQTWQTTRKMNSPLKNLRSLEFSPDEKRFAISVESKVLIYEYENLSLISELPVSTKVINGLAFSPDGSWLALGAADKKIRIWELPLYPRIQ